MKTMLTPINRTDPETRLKVARENLVPGEIGLTWVSDGLTLCTKDDKGRPLHRVGGVACKGPGRWDFGAWFGPFIGGGSEATQEAAQKAVLSALRPLADVLYPDLQSIDELLPRKEDPAP